MKFGQWIGKRVADLVSPHLKSDRSGDAFIYLKGGDSLSHPDDIGALIKAKEVDPFVGIAVSRIATTVAALPLRVYRREYSNGKMQYEEDINHPANNLLDAPNPYDSLTAIKTYMTQALILAGNAYLTIEKSNDGIDIYPKEPDKMKVLFDRNGAVNGYVYGDKQPYEKRYTIEDVCHIRQYDCTNPYYGRSPLIPIEKLILLNYYATETNKAIFRNGPIPAGMFLTDFDLTPEQKETLIKTFEARHKGAENRGKIGVAPSFVKDFKITQLDIKDMLYSEQTRLIREIIFAQLGLPPFVGGVMEYANYANAIPQDRSYYQNTITPITIIEEEALTRQILWRYYDQSRSYVYGYDLSNIPALQENEKEKASNYAILVRSRILTPNEARQLGYSLPPIEGGDELFSTFSFSNTETNSGVDEAKSHVTLHGRKSKSAPDKITWWKSFDARLENEVQKFQRLIKRYLRDQQFRVISAIERYTNGGKILSKLELYSKADVPPDPDSIFNLQKENEALKDIANPAIRDGLRKGAESVFDEFSLDFVFNVRNEKVTDAIASFSSALIKINDVNYETIRSILSEGYNNGLSLSEITKNIREEFDMWNSYRPERIARTEMLGVLNRGNILGYEQAGVGQIEWVSTIDEYSRDTHVAMDGQYINVGERFNVGGELMLHPGDPAASAGNIVNCRCTTMPRGGI